MCKEIFMVIKELIDDFNQKSERKAIVLKIDDDLFVITCSKDAILRTEKTYPKDTILSPCFKTSDYHTTSIAIRLSHNLTYIASKYDPPDSIVIALEDPNSTIELESFINKTFSNNC